MTEEIKRRGRPPKNYLQNEHHYKQENELPLDETSDDAVAAGAPPAAANSGQADVSDGALAPDFASAAPIHEAVVENPTIALDADIPIDLATILSMPSVSITESTPNVEVADTTTISHQNQESPIERKIHQLMDSAALNGWHPINTEIVLKMPPRNGMPIRLSETPDGEGVLAIWKKTRKFANATHRWEESGKWVDFQSGMDISFKPKYWRERY